MSPETKTKVRLLVRLAAPGSLVMAILSGATDYNAYWRIRDCIHENISAGGNGCFVADEMSTYSGSSEIAIGFAVLFLAAAIVLWLLARRLR